MHVRRRLIPPRLASMRQIELQLTAKLKACDFRERSQGLHCSRSPPAPKACPRPGQPAPGPPESRYQMSAPRCWGTPSWTGLQAHQACEGPHVSCLGLIMPLLPQMVAVQLLPTESQSACTCRNTYCRGLTT